MPVEVTQAHREQALLACAILPGVEATRWRVEGWYDPILSKIAEAIAAAEARGFEAGKKAAIDVLRSHCLFDRKHQAEQQKLADHGDLNARGRAYEHELRADYLQELIDACADAGAAGGEGSE
jgi:hypothetical protein